MDPVLDSEPDTEINLDIDLDEPSGAGDLAPLTESPLTVPASLAAASPAAVPAPILPVLPHEALAGRAQGIRCGTLRVAAPFGWARQVVEDFELSPVPAAPAWLAGAANVEGRIVPVIDLAHWARDAAADEPGTLAGSRERLLLGGEGATLLALRFDGLPTLLRTSPAGEAEAAGEDEADALPTRLQGYVRGHAAVPGHPLRWPLIDVPALARTWAAELAR